VLSREKVRPANVLGADADLTEIATNRKKTTAANLDALVYDRRGIHQGVSSTHRNCAF